MGRCGQERTVRTLKALDALGSGARVPWSPRVLTRCCLQVFPVALRLLGADAQIPALSVSGSCKSFAVWTHVSPSIDSSALPPRWSPCVVARRSG